MKRPDDLNSDYAVALERRRTLVVRPERGFLLDTPVPRKENKSQFLLALELEQASAAAKAAADTCDAFYRTGLSEEEIRRMPLFHSDGRISFLGNGQAPQRSTVLPFRRP